MHAKTPVQKFASSGAQHNKNFVKNKTKFKSFKNHKAKVKCHHFEKLGHIKKDCFILKRAQSDKTKQAQVAISQPGEGFAFMIHTSIVPSINDSVSFIIDSGASDHMINDMDLFMDYMSLELPIKIAVAKCGEFISATCKGIVRLQSSSEEQITLEYVLFCNDIPYNLLSVKKL